MLLLPSSQVAPSGALFATSSAAMLPPAPGRFSITTCSPEVLWKLKHRLRETLGAMLSGSRLPPGKRAISFAKTLGGTKEASVVGSRIVTAAANAALANGMLGHADETDDSHAPSQTHPGCGVVAAAFAMAERERAGGTALLRAVALGYDVCCL